MDWIHTLALIYVVVSTPFSAFGFLAIYMLGSAFVSARDDRKDRDGGDY